MARYRKIDTRIWNDAKFRELSADSQLVFFLLLTHPQQTALGAMRHTLSGLAEEMGWEPAAFRAAFKELADRGMVEHDAKRSVICLPNFVRYNRPESPNVVKAWSSALGMLPESNVTDRAVERAALLAKELGEGFLRALPDAFASTLKPAKSAPTNPAAKPAEPDPDEEAFEEAFKALPKRSPSHNRTKARKAWSARRKAGVDSSTLIEGAKRYARFIRASGKERTEFVMMASTFYGPDEHYEQPWEIDQLAPVAGTGNAEAGEPRWLQGAR